MLGGGHLGHPLLLRLARGADEVLGRVGDGLRRVEDGSRQVHLARGLRLPRLGLDARQLSGGVLDDLGGLDELLFGQRLEVLLGLRRACLLAGPVGDQA